MTIAFGYSRRHFTIYLRHTSANHLFFRVRNKPCTSAREQLLIILTEEMAKVTASSDQAKPCSISIRFAKESNFSGRTNESLFPTDMEQNTVHLIDVAFYCKTYCLPPVWLERWDAAVPAKGWRMQTWHHIGTKCWFMEIMRHARGRVPGSKLCSALVLPPCDYSKFAYNLLLTLLIGFLQRAGCRATGLSLSIPL